MKYSRTDFESVAATIRQLPTSKKSKVFDEWMVKFVADNPRFNVDKFAVACSTEPKVKRKILSSEEIVTDFNEWNSIQNRYNLKCVDKNMKLPAGLIDAAIADFEEWCKTFHVDHTKFKYIRASGGCVTWQVDFHDDTDATGVHASVYDIYFNDEKKTIMQRCIMME
jgi:hypothetical protein